MLYFAIVPVAPIRAEARHGAEMVSQLLFGETCILLEKQKDFFKIKCTYDDYEGWCQQSQLALVNEKDFATYQPALVSAYTSELFINNESCIVPLASVVPVSTKTPEIEIGGYKIMDPNNISSFGNNAEPAKTSVLLKEYAFRYMGTAYLWGGKSVWGVDCSGFVQQVFKMLGIKLARDAWQQAAYGAQVDFLTEAKLGDLAFFDNEEGKIIHVGILLNSSQIIHASGCVHIDAIDYQGIIHHVTKERTHRLRIIKRLI